MADEFAEVHPGNKLFECLVFDVDAQPIEGIVVRRGRQMCALSNAGE